MSYQNTVAESPRPESKILRKITYCWQLFAFFYMGYPNSAINNDWKGRKGNKMYTKLLFLLFRCIEELCGWTKLS
jgi:hypothetical protein